MRKTMIGGMTAALAMLAALTACGAKTGDNPASVNQITDNEDAEANATAPTIPTRKATLTPMASASASPTPAPITRAFLVGTWVDDLRGCVGDSATQYAADGSWVENGNSGTWSLEDNRLTMTTSEVFEMGQGDAPQKLDVLTINRWVLKRVGKNRIDYKGGRKRFILIKCP